MNALDLNEKRSETKNPAPKFAILPKAGEKLPEREIFHKGFLTMRQTTRHRAAVLHLCELHIQWLCLSSLQATCFAQTVNTTNEPIHGRNPPMKTKCSFHSPILI
jgi:hypothetical protein